MCGGRWCFARQYFAYGIVKHTQERQGRGGQRGRWPVRPEQRSLGTGALGTRWFRGCGPAGRGGWAAAVRPSLSAWAHGQSARGPRPAQAVVRRAAELACSYRSRVKYPTAALAQTCVFKRVSADLLIPAFSLCVLTAPRIRELSYFETLCDSQNSDVSLLHHQSHGNVLGNGEQTQARSWSGCKARRSGKIFVLNFCDSAWIRILCSSATTPELTSFAES